MTKKSPFDKPFLDFTELIELLVSRGLTINNKVTATELLQEYGYYNLINGFKPPFLQGNHKQNGSEIFKTDASLIKIAGEFFLDSQFQEILLTDILPVENHFKTLIGYEVAKKFGVNDHTADDPSNPDPSEQSYLYPDNYITQNRNSVISFIRNKVLIKCKDNPVKYYRENHNHIPPWILVSNMTLGEAVKFFQILPSKLKTNVVNGLIDPIKNEDLGEKKLLFLSAVEVLRQFRNAAAHSSPVYLTKAHFSPHMINQPSAKVLKKYLGPGSMSNELGISKLNNLYVALLMILLLTQKQARREHFVQKLESLEQSYLVSNENSEHQFTRDLYFTYLEMADLPQDYISRLKEANEILDTHGTLSDQIIMTDLNGNPETFSFEIPRHSNGAIAQNSLVWVLPHGRSYHRSLNCSRIRGSNHQPRQEYLIDAQQQGLTPCKYCN